MRFAPVDAADARVLLRRLTGDPDSEFRDDQLGVIRGLVEGRKRILLVKRTGWGKSAVYFIATRMLRDQGTGPTLLVSPLLALIRNQIEAANRIGIRAETINSSNRSDWKEISSALESDEIDLLLISPERLANPDFRSNVLPEVSGRSGLLVIDEAHCISDWGHDFRPDYRRLVRVLDLLATGVPVLCCTATANDRVVDDVCWQLGSGLTAIRGPLGRGGLHLKVFKLPRQEDRLVFLSEMIPKLPGTGIIYCLTIPDTKRVAEWLQHEGIKAVAYSSNTGNEERESIEHALLSNDLKVVVATSALGMGFDKPDLSFVIHYQSPSSPIAYYQQVGRAGRSMSESWGILMSGSDDKKIQDYFIDSAFPPPKLSERVVKLLEDCSRPMSGTEILESVNLRFAQFKTLMKILEVEGAVERDGSRWLRTLNPWKYDHDRSKSVTALRKAEQGQMGDYIGSTNCRMQLLRRFLDDSDAEPCGICDNCMGGDFFQVSVSPFAAQRALDYLRSSDLPIMPRKRFPKLTGIPKDRQIEIRHHQIEVGRVLSVWGDGGWGRFVLSGKIGGGFDDRLVDASADLIKERWAPDPVPVWVTYVPSLRNPGLVSDFARRLAASLSLLCEDVVVKVRDTETQKLMQNSPQQYANVCEAFEIRGPVPAGPVLLVDDVVDSRWTLTVIGSLLKEAGVHVVYPFALADAAGRSTMDDSAGRSAT